MAAPEIDSNTKRQTGITHPRKQDAAHIQQAATLLVLQSRPLRPRCSRWPALPTGPMGLLVNLRCWKAASMSLSTSATQAPNTARGLAWLARHRLTWCSRSSGEHTQPTELAG